MTGRSPAAAEPLRHPVRGPVFVVTEFWVRVEVPAERDQLILTHSEEMVEFLRQFMPEHEPPPGCSGLASSHRRPL